MNSYHSEVKKITPEEAEKILTTRHENRTISRPVVKKYAADMAMDQWIVTGEPLIFSEQGRLLDGQHRLSATIQAQKTIEFLCVYGISVKAFEKMGQGKKRTFADFLSISGYKNCTTLAAAMNVLNRFRNGSFTNGGDLVSFRTGEELLKRHPGILESITIRKDIPDFFKFKGAIVALHYIFGIVDPIRRDDFFSKVFSGTGLGKDDVELALRNRLITELGRKSSLPDFEVMALVIKSFNLKMDGRTTKCLKWGNTEEYPSVHGFDWKSL